MVSARSGRIPKTVVTPERSITGVRPAALAGRFYPASPAALAAQVEGFLAAAREAGKPGAKAVIAPHAGYPFSGPVAASAFAAWGSDAGRIRRVVVLGPSHFLDFDGIALPGSAAFATPLGTVPVAIGAIPALLACRGVDVIPGAHTPEHCVEVELPFLQVLLRDFEIVPLVVGRASDAEVVAVLDILWGGPETRLLISSDLSHYLPYPEARKIDEATAGAIEELDHGSMGSRHACGHRAIRGFLLAAAARRGSMRTVDLRNSGDTAGPRDAVVGYGAFQFHEAPDPEHRS